MGGWAGRVEWVGGGLEVVVGDRCSLSYGTLPRGRWPAGGDGYGYVCGVGPAHSNVGPWGQGVPPAQRRPPHTRTQMQPPTCAHTDTRSPTPATCCAALNLRSASSSSWWRLHTRSRTKCRSKRACSPHTHVFGGREGGRGFVTAFVCNSHPLPPCHWASALHTCDVIISVLDERLPSCPWCSTWLPGLCNSPLVPSPYPLIPSPCPLIPSPPPHPPP